MKNEQNEFKEAQEYKKDAFKLLWETECTRQVVICMLPLFHKTAKMRKIDAPMVGTNMLSGDYGVHHNSPYFNE